MFSGVESRTVSALPLSVGTSLAFESLFDPVQEPIDPARQIPNRIDINDYDQLWVNVGTLFRNLYNAIDRNAHKFLVPNELADAIVQEMDTIADLVNSYSNGHVGIVFYICTYEDLTDRFKRGSLRLPNTVLQLRYADLYKKTLDVLMKRSRQMRIREIVEYKSKFSGGSKKVLILTHFPVDLLNVYKFKELDLLESHTGILKKQPDWYTKYYDGRDLNFLPLNGILLTVFGDDHHFRPQSRAMKVALIELAQQRRWNCLTHPREIVNGIKTLKDHALRDALLLQEQQ